MQFRVFTDPALYSPPVQRAAYSDRMALLMAEFSALAYIPFENPSELSVADDLIEKVRSAESADKAKRALEKFLKTYTEKTQPQAREELESCLSKAGFSLVSTYNIVETQAFMAKRDIEVDGEKTPGIVVLSFRGTEKKIADWRTDLDAKITTVEGVGVHRGFWKAFEAAEPSIRAELEPLLEQGYSLYVTGHSLGGALALFATYHLGGDSTGACYTFGSPRVAGYGFSEHIKTPIYRVVNAHDIVPRTPPHVLPHILLFLLSLIRFPGRDWMVRVIQNYVGYVHHGDMRYLTRGREESHGAFDDVKLLANPSMFDRARWWLTDIVSDWAGPIKDHDIQLYCDKLRAYAKRRNEP